MWGAIAGDIIGSVYERRPIKTTNFPLFTQGNCFTDDTVMTVAVADALMSANEKGESSYTEKLQAYGRKYPNAGYGGMFFRWIFNQRPEPYNSFGNGAAMRVSPVGFYFNDLTAVLKEAERSAAITHSHPEGIKGAQATAAAVFLARTGHSKEQIREYVADTFGYQLNRSLNDIRPHYGFDVTCQGSVPESIIAFLEADDVETAIRNAISLGGDADTMACIAGGVAEAFYGGVPEYILKRVREYLDADLLEQVEMFSRVKIK